MRVGYVLLALVFILELDLFQHVSSSMVTMPASVAFAIITAAVKMKLILVKLMFAWRTMGKYRFKRSAPEEQDQNKSENAHEDAYELLLAWKELESTAERQIIFHFPSCDHGATTGSTLTNYETANDESDSARHSLTGHPPKDAQVDADADSARLSLTSHPPQDAPVDDYSKFVSSVIGSMTGSSEACHILQEAILSES